MERVEALLSAMTVAEKAGQLKQYFYFAHPAAGEIPAADAPGAFPADQATAVEAALARGEAGSLLLTGEQDGEIVACCQLRNEGGGLAYFGTFAVSPSAQGGVPERAAS